MKKILLFLFIVFVVVNAEDTCPTNWTVGGQYSILNTSGLAKDAEPARKFIISSSDRSIVYGVYTEPTGPYPCSWDNNRDCMTDHYYQYACSCKIADANYELPEGSELTIPKLVTNCNDTPEKVSEVEDECNNLGGFMFRESITNCCETSVCIVDENSTSPDDNSTEPISCPIDSSYSPFTKKCECNPGHYPGNECHNDDCSDLECIADPCTLPNSHYSSSSSSCVCNDGYTPRYGLNSLEECISSPDTNSSDGSSNDDPCSYQDSENGFSYKGKNYDSSICQDNIKEFGCGNGTFVKHDGCSFGACYYNYDLDCPQDDSNSTGGSSNDSDTNDNSIDDNNTGSSTVDDNSTTSLALDELDKSINSGVDKITDAVKNNTHVLSDKLSILDSTISSGVDKISNSIDSEKSVLHDDLEDIKDLLKGDHSEDEATLNDTFSNTNNIVQDALSSFKVSQENLQALADGAKPPVFSTTGDCSLSTSLGKFGNFEVDFRKPAELIAPYFHFALDIALLILTIRFYITIVLSIASLFS